MSVGTPQPDAVTRLTLTATDRLARQLREDENLARARSGASVWEAPRIATFSRWLSDTWAASWPDAQLLSATQELVLWTQAVQRDAGGLLSVQGAAREARRADQLLRRYNIDLDTAPAWQEEHQAFRRWRRQVQRRLDQNGWITAADVPAAVARLIAQEQIAVPQALALAGFVHAPTPCEQAVLGALRARGTQVEVLAANATLPSLKLLRSADAESQWRWVAADIRERLSRASTDPPRILIALPEAEGPRVLAESVLRDLLAPWVTRGEGAQPWRWERAAPLSEHPVVESLLALLQLRAVDNPPALISRVLLSASLWTQEELAHTSAADYALRACGLPRLRMSAVRASLPPELAARFAEFARLGAALTGRALPSRWAEVFRTQLAALGWPGGPAPDSQTFQAIGAARALLDRLGTLDRALGPVPLAQAQEWLAEFARASRHAARVEHAQPVLVTTIEEAAALRADVLYLLDASAAQLPGAARPTPLVALETQRAAGVPEAKPETWFARTQAQLAQLLAYSAPEVIVCAPLTDARGAQLMPASLPGVDAVWADAPAARCIGALETALPDKPVPLVPEDPVPPVTAAEKVMQGTGSALFKDWFESPFFAFCIHRLGIKPLPEPARGLDARVQGTLVHRALERLWGELDDSRALAALDPSALRARVAAVVDEVSAQLLPAADYGAVTRRLETARAQDLVRQWLEQERERRDAFSVVLRETPVETEVAGLRLRLRMDRVDRVESPYGERWLLLDYKTGSEATAAGWKLGKLKEPQLPLYASFAATRAAGVPRVDGIAFAHLKDGHPALLSKNSWREKLDQDKTADISEAWNLSLREWRDALEAAALAFLAGEAWMQSGVTERSFNAPLLALTDGSAEDADEDEGTDS